MKTIRNLHLEIVEELTVTFNTGKMFWLVEFIDGESVEDIKVTIKLSPSQFRELIQVGKEKLCI